MHYRASKFVVVALTVSALLTTAVAASAASKVTISGKVKGGKGYVISLINKSGRSINKELGSSGAFKLKVKSLNSKGAVLQLVNPNSNYHGPVVLARKGKKAYLGLKGGQTSVGTIKLKKGYAVLIKKLDSEDVSFSQAAKTNAAGKPIGAGKLGLVKSKTKSSLSVTAATGEDHGNGGGNGGSSSGPKSPSGDPDRDGIANAFDADDDGDIILDNMDSNSGSAASDGVFATLYTDLASALNANTGNVTRAAIDQTFQQNTNLIFYFDDQQFNGTTVSYADVDCFSLPYCAPGSGTATISGITESGPDLPRGNPWISYDLNGDGLPNLEAINQNGMPVHAMSIIPKVTTPQIAPGDSFNVKFTTDSGPINLLRTVSPYFITSPAVISYNAGAGAQTVSYPISAGAAGTNESNPIVMTSQQLALTLYKPQRATLPGENGDYMDIGRLHYGIPLEVDGKEFGCANNYSGLSSTLSNTGTGSDFATQLFPLSDSANDQAPSPSDTVSFTIDIGACASANGVSVAGKTLGIAVSATGESRPGGVDRTAQTIRVKMPS